MMADVDPVVETLRSKISIVGLIGEATDLAQAGDRFRGACPAHRDLGRGLFVDDAEGLYRCFACGRQGDIVRWVRETLDCSEDAAIAILRQRAGLCGPS